MNVKSLIGYAVLLLGIAALLIGVGSLSREAHGTGVALVAIGAPLLAVAWHTLRSSSSMAPDTSAEE